MSLQIYIKWRCRNLSGSVFNESMYRLVLFCVQIHGHATMGNRDLQLEDQLTCRQKPLTIHQKATSESFMSDNSWRRVVL